MRDKSGLVYTIKYMKQVRLHITRYICGHPLKSNDCLVSLTKGFPTRFLYLKEIIDSNNFIKIRGVLTLLYFTRSIIPTKEEESRIKPTLTTINAPYKGKNYSIPMWFIDKFVKDNHLLSDKPKFDQSLHYLSSKGSPFGKSTAMAPFGLLLMAEHCHSMLENFLTFIGFDAYHLIYGNFLKKLWYDHRLMWIGNVNKGNLGKLAIVKDPELKRRVIAMLDYNSQLLLRPIHDNLLKLLTKFSQDRTYTQDPHNNWGKTYGHSFWSLDLSAATDRFPIALQVKLLSAIYNDRTFAETWQKILVNRIFTFNDKNLCYSVGQPMGAYSSWAAFTITHHLVVHWAAHLCGLTNFKKYIILGDDIVINHDKVARKYIKIMNNLGVDISLNKTHVSKNTYEFAKRWIRRSIEVSPLPLKGILLNLNRPQVVLQQLMIYIQNNNTVFKGTTLDLVMELYDKVKINKRFYTKSSINKLCYDFYHVLRYAYGYITPIEVRKYLCMKNIDQHIEIPGENLVLSFLREILFLGLTKQAESSAYELSKMFNNFVNFFKSKYKDDAYDVLKLKDHPTLHAINNRLSSIKKDLMKIRSDPNLDLIDAMNVMNVESVDKIVSLKRDTSITVTRLDRLWRRSLASVILIPEANLPYHYLNSFGMGSTNLKPWESSYLSSLDQSKDKIDLVKAGTDPDNLFANAMWF
jgi:hypothetical protein